MVKVRALEAPPPGAGFFTVTVAVPAVAISAAWILAVTWPLFTKVVARAAPFHSTVQPDTRLAPFTVRVNAGPPCVALGGVSEASEGTGLGATTFTLSEVVAVLPVGSPAEAVMVRTPALPERAGKVAL